MSKGEKQAMVLEKMFTKDMPDKGMLSKNIILILKLNNKKTKYSNKKSKRSNKIYQIRYKDDK